MKTFLVIERLKVLTRGWIQHAEYYTLSKPYPAYCIIIDPYEFTVSLESLSNA